MSVFQVPPRITVGAFLAVRRCFFHPFNVQMISIVPKFCTGSVKQAQVARRINAKRELQMHCTYIYISRTKILFDDYFLFPNFCLLFLTHALGGITKPVTVTKRICLCYFARRCDKSSLPTMVGWGHTESIRYDG